MIRVLSLGDSYTIGEGVEISERWPVQLADGLRRRGIPTEDPLIIARTGWTTGDLQAGISQSDPQGVYDLVTLLIGVNNQYRGEDVEQYRQEFRLLLKQAINFAGNKRRAVLVISIPDWGVTPFARGLDHGQIAAEIESFNTVNRQEAKQTGVVYIDITPASRRAAQDAELLASDGLHPSGVMYAEWVNLMLPIVVAIIGAR